MGFSYRLHSFPSDGTGYAGSMQDFMHVYIVTALVVLLSIISIGLIIVGGFKDGNKYCSLSLWAILTLLFMLIGPIGTSIIPRAYFGVSERFSVYSIAVFNAILGLYGFIYIDKIEKRHEKVKKL